MYQVIARKYRPRSFEDLIGQEHVKTTLVNAIAQNRIAHGYIFSGQRGTGKTTVARILARCLNCVQGPTTKPCGSCAACQEIAAGSSLDVIEIDAASNRGINEMRELRESVRFHPARDRNKIFIIDEAHQITSEGFNALLKTLEEPPEWVVFVLCTTEAHKIPNTIASRCQQFHFRSVDFDVVLERLRSICAQEGVEADEESLGVIALAGEGSVRDSLSALDQAIACCGKTLRAQEVRQLLGRFSMETLEEVAQALLDGDRARMLTIVDALERDGQNLQHFTRELCRFFRNLLVARIAGAQTRLVVVSGSERQRLQALAERFSEEDLTRYLNLALELFRQMQFSLNPRMHLELALVKLVHAGRLRAIEEVLAELAPASNSALPAAPASGAPSAAAKPRHAAALQSPASPAAGNLKSRLLAALKERGLTFIADAVEHSQVVERPGTVEFSTAKEFLMALRSADLQKTLDALLGRPVKISVQAGAAAEPRPEAQPDDDVERRALEHPEVRRFREIFEGSEIRAVRNLKEQR